MPGMLKPYEIAAMNRDVADKRVRPVYAHVITRIDETAGAYYDPFGGGSLNPTNDPVTYAKSVSCIYARVMWNSPGITLLQEIAPGVMLGDCVLGINARDQAFVESLIGNEDSFLMIDGRACLPREVIPSRVEGDTGVYVMCELKNTDDVQQVLK